MRHARVDRRQDRVFVRFTKGAIAPLVGSPQVESLQTGKACLRDAFFAAQAKTYYGCGNDYAPQNPVVLLHFLQPIGIAPQWISRLQPCTWHTPASVPPKLELVERVGGGVVVVLAGDVGMVVVVVDAGIGAELGISEAFMLVFESITTVTAMMAASRIRRSGCFMVTTLDSSRSFMQTPAQFFHCVRNS